MLDEQLMEREGVLNVHVQSTPCVGDEVGLSDEIAITRREIPPPRGGETNGS
jgi:hypothetical protein